MDLVGEYDLDKQVTPEVADMKKDKHRNNLYQFGYNFSSNGNFSYGIMGGISRGAIENVDYNTDITTINVGNSLNYSNGDLSFILSGLYGLSSFDMQRDYFISLYNVEEAINLDQSKLKGTLRTHEILFDAQLSYNLINEGGFILSPRIYVTPSVFLGEEYKEQGEYSSVIVDQYVLSIIESGIGIDVIQSFRTGIELFLSGDAFYRNYSLPEGTVHFKELSEGMKVEKEEYSGLVITPKAGISIGNRNFKLSAYYKREMGKDYYQNIVGVNYKYGF